MGPPASWSGSLQLLGKTDVSVTTWESEGENSEPFKQQRCEREVINIIPISLFLRDTSCQAHLGY